MIQIETFKAAHVAAAAKRFDEAIETLRIRLNYDRAVFYRGFTATDATREHDAKARKLARLILTCSEGTRHSVFGGIEYGFGITLNAYSGQMGYDLCSLMEFIGYFIGHEILDDGEPGLGYYRSTVGDKERTADTFVRCGPDVKGAQPYFCRSIDWLREDYPEAEWLSLDGAIAAIEWHEKRRADMAASIRRHIEEHGEKSFWDADDLAAYEQTEQERQYAALADELEAGRRRAK